MALDQDLNDAVDNILAKNDALIVLVGQLNDAIKNANVTLPAAVTAAIAKLTAESAKDDSVLHPTPPAAPPAV